MSTRLNVRVPTRIDFAGGWSDVPDFAAREGGAVLNAAIDHYVEGTAKWDDEGLHIEYRLNVPPDSHLGTSSASNLAWLELIHGLTGKAMRPADRAEQAYALETAIGNKGGKQDHYAAALGEVGSSEDSGELHEQVWRRFADGDLHIRDCLRAIRDSVRPATEALKAGDWSGLGIELTRNRELVRSLGGGAVTGAMDAMFSARERAGAPGAKGCGAGSGGYLLFLAGDGRRDAIEEALMAGGGTLLPFALAPRRDT